MRMADLEADMDDFLSSVDLVWTPTPQTPLDLSPDMQELDLALAEADTLLKSIRIN